MDTDNILELEPGYSGKAQLLIEAILGVICVDQFADLTVAEVIGCLELVKADLIQKAS